MKNTTYGVPQSDIADTGLREALAKDLRDGSIREIGAFERLKLKRAGRSDGRQDLPRQTEGGEWSSAFIAREINAYTEFCHRVWGRQQLTLCPQHARCDELYDEIHKLTEKLEAVKKQAEGDPPAAAFFRKRGEEALSDSQVQARRSREAGREQARRSAAVAAAEDRLEAAYRELSAIYAYITESDNAARLVCARVMNHARQRIDVYWRATAKTHSDASTMPVAVHPVFGSEAEQTYIAKRSLKDTSIRALLAAHEAGKTESEVA